MKRSTKTKRILAALLMSTLLFGMVSCSNSGDSETTPPNNDTTADTTADTTETTPPSEEETAPEEEETETETTAPAEETETEAPAVATPPAPTWEYVIEQMSEYHYMTFACPYTDGNGEVGGSASGGYFDESTDDMAKFIAENPEWYKDTDLMSTWDTAEGPFGDAIEESIAAPTDFIMDKENTNGLMVFRTFEVGPMTDLTYFTLNCFYDNTVYIYINGELYYSHDANCGSGDWNGGYEPIPCNVDSSKTLRDYIHEGENYIAISIKNCWGGRELDLELLRDEQSATKRTVTLIPTMSEWSYQVFSAPYIGGDGEPESWSGGGYFPEETDEMAKFIAEHPDFMTDYALYDDWAVGQGPMSSGAEGWTESNHGLIVHKAFTVEDLNDVLSCDYFDLNCFYDNAIHVYLNGVEIYSDDTACAGQDWNGNYTEYTTDAGTLTDVSGILVEGENHMVVTIKDAYGGREFDAGFSAEWN